MSARQAGGGLVRRPARAVPTGLVGVILLVFGGLGLWLLGTYLIEGRWPVAAANSVDALAWTTLESIAAQAAAGAMVVLGLVLVVFAAWPGRPSRLLIMDDEIPGETALSRRDLARHLQSAAENVDGVHSVRVAPKRRRIDVDVITVVDDPAPVVDAASAAVDRAMHELRPSAPTATRVRARRR